MNADSTHTEPTVIATYGDLVCKWTTEPQPTYIDDSDSPDPHLYVEPREDGPPLITLWDWEDDTELTWAFLCDIAVELGTTAEELFEASDSVSDALRKLTLRYVDLLLAATVK